jgi:hypothetical protein
MLYFFLAINEKKLEIYMKRYKGIKDFVWRVLSKLLHFDNCEKAFVTKHGPNIHVNYYTGKRPYPCRIDGCKKAFPDPNSRLYHERKVNYFKKDDDDDDDNNNRNDQQKSIMVS